MSLLRRLYNVSKSYGYSLFNKLTKKEQDIPFGMFDESDDKYTEKVYPKSHRGKPVDPVLAQYYANLGIPYGSDKERVMKAWKGLLRKCHPDLHSTNPEKKRIATILTQKLNEAYNAINKALAEGKV